MDDHGHPRGGFAPVTCELLWVVGAVTLLVILVGAVVVVVATAAMFDVRARRRGRRAAEDGWDALKETRRDFHAAELARYQSSDFSWLDRVRRNKR
ncbi:hypothetical protein [Amycolatopsis sp. DSM 110486]|uniref:hypothetical protein n=1 Tax=Amycolatopsis sp. DSM 110486 TaxID=2865832 RepID=UPI001C69CB2E|nr:hypothetical protein [Amycolatopsis sp. DSM 110486]QYN23272.1 hypothetical protein K1T34_12890 [Amycolatopsis sp. DSM 110486]